jgi:hypothetical protein
MACARREQQGFGPAAFVQEVSDLMPTLVLVAAGLGSTFVPSAMGRRLSLRDVMFRPLAEVDNVPTWPFAIAHMPMSAGSDVVKLLNLWKRAGSL